MDLRSSFLLVIACCCLFTAQLNAQNYQPSPENIEARSWFQDARFGLFVHWGVYSILGDGEMGDEQPKHQCGGVRKITDFFQSHRF
jgi:alpha-L-fucosidase